MVMTQSYLPSALAERKLLPCALSQKHHKACFNGASSIVVTVVLPVAPEEAIGTNTPKYATEQSKFCICFIFIVLISCSSFRKLGEVYMQVSYEEKQWKSL